MVSNKKYFNVDRRTFVIVVIIVAITLPIIVFVFRKSFFPIITSIRNSFNSAALTNGATGLPVQFRNLFNGK